MIGYLYCAKEEKPGSKQRGELEEKEAVPISFELYRLSNKLAIIRDISNDSKLLNNKVMKTNVK